MNDKLLTALLATGGGRGKQVYVGGIGYVPVLTGNAVYPHDLHLIYTGGKYRAAAMVNGELIAIDTPAKLISHLPKLATVAAAL